MPIATTESVVVVEHQLTAWEQVIGPERHVCVCVCVSGGVSVCVFDACHGFEGRRRIVLD